MSRHISPEKTACDRTRKKERNRENAAGKDFLNMTNACCDFQRFIYAFRIKYLDIDVSFGLKEPAYTGIITGFMHALAYPGSDIISGGRQISRDRH